VAERERFRTDRRAVTLGLARFALVGPVAFAVVCTFRYVFEPVVRDLAGGVSLPGLGWCAVLAATVGGATGWGRMRGARRIVVSGHAATRDGKPDALALARLARAAEGSAGVQEPIALQRWSPDLLGGGDLHAVPEMTPAPAPEPNPFAVGDE
jgi:hypothetical protein